MDLFMQYLPVASQPLPHAISSNPAAMSTGHSYAVLCRPARDTSTTQSRPLIIIQSHSRSVYPADTEMCLPFPAFVAQRPEVSCSGEVPDLRRNPQLTCLWPDGQEDAGGAHDGGQALDRVPLFDGCRR